MAGLITWWLVKGQLSTAREQLRIELYLQFRRDFDGDRLISARKKLAQQLLEDTPHDEIQENVMDFFEDMGMQLRRGYLDREMIWDTFSYYAKMWGSACKDYIDAERRRLEDQTLFSDFRKLTERISEEDAQQRDKTRADLEPSVSEIRAFLETEAQLRS